MRGQYKFLSEGEQLRLLRAIKQVKGADSELGRQAERDYAIIETFLNTGLRRAELAGLKVGDVRGKDRMWIVGKGKKGRFVRLNVHVQRVLRVWIARKLSRGESINEEAPLFVSRLGRGLALNAINNLVRLWMLRAGLTTMQNGKARALYTVHSLRHSCFKLMVARGVDVTRIKGMAGHESLDTTMIYTEPTDEEMGGAAEAAAV